MQRKLWKYALSQGWEKELILFCQILLMAILLFLMADPLLSNLQTFRKVTALYPEQPPLIHVVSEKEPELDEKILAFSLSHAVIRQAHNMAEKADSASLLGYSKAWLEQIPWEIDQQEKPLFEEAIPLLAPSAYRDIYEMHGQIALWLAEDDQTCVGEIVGYFQNEQLPILESHGSLPRLTDFYLSISDHPVLVSLEPVEGVSWRSEYLMETPDPGEDNLKTVRESMGSEVKIRLLEEEIHDTWNTYVMDHAKVIFAFSLFLLVAVFGFGAYIALVFREKRQTMQILHLNGLSYGKIRGLFMSTYGLLVNIPLLLGWAVVPLIGKVLFAESVPLPKIPTLLVAIGLMGILLWAFTGFEFEKMKKHVRRWTQEERPWR